LELITQFLKIKSLGINVCVSYICFPKIEKTVNFTKSFLTTKISYRESVISGFEV